MRALLTTGRAGRGLLLSTSIALALMAVPLQRMVAVAHDPVGTGAGMATRAPLLVENAARSVLLAGSTFGGARTLLATGRTRDRWASVLHPVQRLVQVWTDPAAVLLLTIYGRWQLEGG